MKVILANRTVYPFHQVGGVEKNVYYLSRALVRAGAEVEIVASLPPGGEQSADLDGIHHTFLWPHTSWVPQYGLRPSIGIFGYSLNLARYLRGRQFDALHSFGILPYAYLHLPGRRAVVYQPFEEVFTLDLTPGVPLDPRQGLMVAMKRHLDRSILSHADEVAYTSDAEAEALRHTFGIEPERLVQIPAGIELRVIDEAVSGATFSRGLLGLSQEDYLVVYVGRLVPEKGLANLAAAFDEVVRRVPQAHLLVVGEGPEGPLLDRRFQGLQLSEHLRRFSSLSEADLYGLLSLCDCYVSPGLDMHWSLSFLEAMACGLPVVSTSHQQWVRDGENGYLVPQGDPQALAEAIVCVLECGRAREMGAVSRGIATQYDHAAIAQQALAGYEQALARRAHGN